MARIVRGKKARGFLPRWLVVLIVGLIGISGLLYLRVSIVDQYYRYRYQDFDRDGIANWRDADMDGDGIDNFEDDDANGNGKENTVDIVRAARDMISRVYDIPGGIGLTFGDRLGLMNEADVALVACGRAGLFLQQLFNNQHDNATASNREIDRILYRKTDLLLSRLSAHGYAYDAYNLPEPGDLVFFNTGYLGVITSLSDTGVFKCVIALASQVQVVELSATDLKAKGHRIRCYAQIAP